MSTGTTLYYPYIHPRSLGKIKSALLYWDRVRRIVPRSVREGDHARDDARDARVLADRGLLVSTDPERYQEKAAERFFAELKQHSNRLRLDRKAARGIFEGSRAIHIEKIADPVLKRLRSTRLAHQFGDWVAMHEEVGALYMYCLAVEMGSQIDAPLFAEAQADATVGQTLLFEPDTSGDVTDILASLQIGMPSAEQLADIDVETLAKFVERRAGERRRFRSALESIVEKVRTTSDPNAIEDYLRDQGKEIREAIGDTRSVLGDLWTGAVGGLMRITVPAGVAALVGALAIPPESAMILQGTGIAISGVSLFAETRGKLRTAKRTSAYHYITLLQTELRAKKTRASSTLKLTSRLRRRKRT